MAGAPGGLVVTADEQSAGRGRQGRSWFAPPGIALLYSALLRPLGERPLLPLAVPLAVCEAAESLAPVSMRGQVAERRLGRRAQAGGRADRVAAPAPTAGR